MSAKVLWVLAGVAVAAGTVAALLLVGPKSLADAPPNAELAPAGLVFYAEADAVGPLWDAVSRSGAWKDFQASRVLGAIRDTPTAKAAQDLLTRLETNAGYAIDAKRAMYFCGREVSVAVDAVPAEGDPSWLALSKLDVDALVRELLSGNGDWTKLQDELARRTGKLDFVVTKGEHHGQSTTTARRGDVVFHAAVLGDTLAVSNSLPLLQRTIDVHAAGGEGSLGRTPKFRDEVARLPKTSAAHAYLDLEALRASRTAIDRAASEAKVPGVSLGAVADRVLDGTAGAPALAWATELPEGDLYQVRWSYSRTAAELSGVAGPRQLTPLFRGFPITGECRDVGAVADAWNASALKRKLVDGPFGEQVREWTEKPKELKDLLAESPFGRGAGMSPGFDDPDAPEESEAAKDPGAPAGSGAAAGGAADPGAPDAFAMKLGLHFLGRFASSLTTGDVAFGADAPAEGEPFGAFAVRLGTEGYLAALALEGDDTGPAAVQRSAYATTTVFHADGRPGSPMGGGVAWAHLGDVAVIASSEDAVHRMIDAASTAAASAPSGTAFPDGWFLRAHWESRAFLDALRKALPPDDSRLLDASFPAEGDFAVYVGEAFRSFEVRSVASLPETAPAVAGPAQPACWAWLPDAIVLASGGSTDLRETYDRTVAQVPDAVRKEIDDALAAMRDETGVDLVGDLLPALGPEIAFSVSYAAAPSAPSEAGQPGMPEPIAVPGVLVSIGVKDEGAVGRALDAFERAIRKSMAEASQGRRGGPRLVREDADGLTTLRIDAPDGGPVHLSPTLTFGRGKVLVGLEQGTVAAALDAERGKAPSFARSALAARVRESVGEMGSGWSVLDWGRMLDQVEVYLPQIADTFPPSELPDGRKAPEWPDDPDEAAMQRFERDSEAFAKEARGVRTGQVKKWIDACRVVDFMASGVRIADRRSHAHLVIRFAD